MRVFRSGFTAAFAGSLMGIAGSANSLAAEEMATRITPPAVRLETVNACRIISPTFAPNAAHQGATDVRYPGGGKLSFPVAAPCPARIVVYDI